MTDHSSAKKKPKHPALKTPYFGVQERLVSSNKLIFIFTGWGSRVSQYAYFVRQLNKKGYACIIYDYPDHVAMDGDLDEYRRMYDEVIADAQSRLAVLKRSGFTHFSAYGYSLGTLIANKFTRDTPEVTHVVLNLTYGDIARTVWKYKGVKKAKENLIKRGYTEQAVRNFVTFADPVHNAKGLKGKKVLLYLAKNDRVLRHQFTQKTKEALELHDVDFLYIENKYLGHVLGGVKNMLRTSTLLDFLSK